MTIPGNNVSEDNTVTVVWGRGDGVIYEDVGLVCWTARVLESGP